MGRNLGTVATTQIIPRGITISPAEDRRAKLKARELYNRYFRVQETAKDEFSPQRIIGLNREFNIEIRKLLELNTRLSEELERSRREIVELKAKLASGSARSETA